MEVWDDGRSITCFDYVQFQPSWLECKPPIDCALEPFPGDLHDVLKSLDAGFTIPEGDDEGMASVENMK